MPRNILRGQEIRDYGPRGGGWLPKDRTWREMGSPHLYQRKRIRLDSHGGETWKYHSSLLHTRHEGGPHCWAGLYHNGGNGLRGRKEKKNNLLGLGQHCPRRGYWKTDHQSDQKQF